MYKLDGSIIFSSFTVTAKRLFTCMLICLTNSFMDKGVIHLFYVAGYCHCCCWTVVWLYAIPTITRRYSWQIG